MTSPQPHRAHTNPRTSVDPMARVLDLEGRARKYVGIGLLGALLVHGTAAARTALIPVDLINWSHSVSKVVHDRLWSTYDVDMFKAPEDKAPPPPEPEPEKQPDKAPPPPIPQAKDAPEPPKDEPPPPAPTPAQAGQVLTAPDEPLDFTGQGFTQGTAATYAGGVTHAQGTATTAVRNVAARPDGVPGATGSAPPPPPAVDKTRAAGLRGSSEWKCPWPSEADAEQIDEAYVTVQVTVGPDGRAKSVAVTSDPGHGFGREARLCAMRETYTTALDKDGTAIVGQTKAFRIHFER